jgi:hypothetical protein
VGGAPAELIDGRDLVDFAVEWIVTNVTGAHRRPDIP